MDIPDTPAPATRPLSQDPPVQPSGAGVSLFGILENTEMAAFSGTTNAFRIVEAQALIRRGLYRPALGKLRAAADAAQDLAQALVGLCDNLENKAAEDRKKGGDS